MPKQITFVKKQRADGQPCRKCQEVEELLQKRGVRDRITRVVWAVEGQPDSAGMKLGERFGVSLAPFFVVTDPAGGETVYTSALKFLKEQFPDPPPAAPAGSAAAEPAAVSLDYPALAARFHRAHPREVLAWALDRFGADCALAFSGAEDVALIDLAAKTGLPYSVFTLDTGRLHPETLRFLDRVRTHYGIEIAVMSPNAADLEAFVRAKGLFSFYQDGHQECCGIRKVEPLRRALKNYRAWVSGQRQDQSPATRSEVAVIEADTAFSGREAELVKLNPLANWSSADVWQYIRDNDVPYNELHDRGFVSIGCEPCTRPARPGEHERAARWWWEAATQRECGLHVKP